MDVWQGRTFRCIEKLVMNRFLPYVLIFLAKVFSHSLFRVVHRLSRSEEQPLSSVRDAKHNMSPSPWDSIFFIKISPSVREWKFQSQW